MTEPEKERWIFRHLWWGVGVPVVLTVVFAVIQGLRENELRNNERKASAALKMLATAQADFRANDSDGNKVQDYWTADVVGLWRSVRMVPRGIAEADAFPLKGLVDNPKPYHGYYFRVLKGDLHFDLTYNQDTDGSGREVHNSSRFGFCAYPVEFGSTGRWTFIINENNTIFKFQQEGEPFKDWPTDVFLSGDWPNNKGD